MIKFNRISPSADFYSKLTQLELKLEIMNKNVLYVTHECDKILKLLKSLENSSNLQKQVDEYFEDEEPTSYAESTSPQTELETKV